MLARVPPQQPAPRDLAAQVARAAGGPAAVVAAGAGMGIGELAGLPWEAVVGVAIGTWALRMAAFAARAYRRARRRPGPLLLDPYAVPEPWRSMVRQVVAARDRFDETVQGWPPGPMRDRLVELNRRVAASAEEAFRVAKQAAALAATARLADASTLSAQLAELQGRRAAQAPDQPAGLNEREAALAARLQSARRMEAQSTRASDRLGVLVAQLGDAVSAVVELSFQSADDRVALPLLGSLEDLVTEITALHVAVEEATDPAAGPLDRRTS